VGDSGEGSEDEKSGNALRNLDSQGHVGKFSDANEEQLESTLVIPLQNT
jgi:hypothetical protein